MKIGKALAAATVLSAGYGVGVGLQAKVKRPRNAQEARDQASLGSLGFNITKDVALGFADDVPAYLAALYFKKRFKGAHGIFDTAIGSLGVVGAGIAGTFAGHDFQNYIAAREYQNTSQDLNFSQSLIPDSRLQQIQGFNNQGLAGMQRKTVTGIGSPAAGGIFYRMWKFAKDIGNSIVGTGTPSKSLLRQQRVAAFNLENGISSFNNYQFVNAHADWQSLLKFSRPNRAPQGAFENGQFLHQWGDGGGFPQVWGESFEASDHFDRLEAKLEAERLATDERQTGFRMRFKPTRIASDIRGRWKPVQRWQSTPGAFEYSSVRGGTFVSFGHRGVTGYEGKNGLGEGGHVHVKGYLLNVGIQQAKPQFGEAGLDAWLLQTTRPTRRKRPKMYDYVGRSPQKNASRYLKAVGVPQHEIDDFHALVRERHGDDISFPLRDRMISAVAQKSRTRYGTQTVTAVRSLKEALVLDPSNLRLHDTMMSSLQRNRSVVASTAKVDSVSRAFGDPEDEMDLLHSLNMGWLSPKQAAKAKAYFRSQGFGPFKGDPDYDRRISNMAFMNPRSPAYQDHHVYRRSSQYHTATPISPRTKRSLQRDAAASKAKIRDARLNPIKGFRNQGPVAEQRGTMTGINSPAAAGIFYNMWHNPFADMLNSAITAPGDGSAAEDPRGKALGFSYAGGLLGSAFGARRGIAGATKWGILFGLAGGAYGMYSAHNPDLQANLGAIGEVALGAAPVLGVGLGLASMTKIPGLGKYVKAGLQKSTNALGFTAQQLDRFHPAVDRFNAKTTRFIGDQARSWTEKTSGPTVDLINTIDVASMKTNNPFRPEINNGEYIGRTASFFHTAVTAPMSATSWLTREIISPVLRTSSQETKTWNQSLAVAQIATYIPQQVMMGSAAISMMQPGRGKHSTNTMPSNNPS